MSTLKQACSDKPYSTLRMYGNHMEASGFQIVLVPKIHKMPDCN